MSQNENIATAIFTKIRNARADLFISGICKYVKKTKSKSNNCLEALTQEKNGMQIQSKLMVIKKH